MGMTAQYQIDTMLFQNWNYILSDTVQFNFSIAVMRSLCVRRMVKIDNSPSLIMIRKIAFQSLNHWGARILKRTVTIERYKMNVGIIVRVIFWTERRNPTGLTILVSSKN